MLCFRALKCYYKQNGHTGDEGQKVPRWQDQQFEDLRALLFWQGVKHSPASSPQLTLQPVPAVPAAPPQRCPALWQKGKNPEHPHAHIQQVTQACVTAKTKTGSGPSGWPSASLRTCPSLAPRTPGRTCMPGVQLPLLTFNTCVSPINNHHVCAITASRKSAGLHSSLPCQSLPTPLGVPAQGLNGPASLQQYPLLDEEGKRLFSLL